MPPPTRTMWWDDNQSITAEQFETLYADFLKHAEGKTLFAQDLYGGADPSFQIKTRVFTELAWHSLFIRTLLIRPEASRARELRARTDHHRPAELPRRSETSRLRSENVVAIDFARKIVLIGGSHYAGEMKKTVFTTLNYYLPAKGVMPMHCSANVGPEGRHRDLLRPVRHRQDHAVGRPEPHADRRRRARLGQGRRLQLRRRLLRQVHQAVEGSRAARSSPPASASAPCWRTSCSTKTPACRISTTARRPRTPARPIRSTSSRTPRAPAAPASRRTS